MSMTPEEAITILQDKYDCCKSFYDLAAHPEEDYPEMAKYLQALRIALAAFRPVSREQVEKVWRGEWIGMTDDDGYTWYECSRCEYGLDSLESPNHFCPACGAPMTDEAVEMVMERLEELHESIHND